MLRILIVIFLFIYMSGAYAKGGVVSVKGYTKKDGTYVAPHMRSAPDGSTANNWSTDGNVNPYTGELGTKDPADAHSNTQVLSNDSINSAPLPTQVKSIEKVKIPKNGKLNYFGNGWECERGFHQVGSECASVAIPSHANLNYFGNGWECERGFHQVGSECASVMIPPNAKLNYFGNEWECERGFRQMGNECSFIKIPANGKLNYFGNGWECNRGFHQIANECIKVVIPQNAKLNYFGNGWECYPGYKASGTKCNAEIPQLNN